MYKETKVHYEVDEKKSVERDGYLLSATFDVASTCGCAEGDSEPICPSFMTNQFSSQNIPTPDSRVFQTSREDQTSIDWLRVICHEPASFYLTYHQYFTFPLLLPNQLRLIQRFFIFRF